MTVQNINLRKAGPALGNGINKVFPFTFKVFAASEVLVTYLDASSVESTLALSVDYTVALNADQNAFPGGAVNMVLAPAYNTSITLTSNVANTQNLMLSNSGGFYPSSINDALDRATIQIQQLAEQLSRTFKVPISSLVIAGKSVADYLSAAAASENNAATSAAASASSAVQSGVYAADSALSASYAWASQVAAAASALAATVPTTRVMADFIDTCALAFASVTLNSIYIAGGWDLGSIVSTNSFRNETLLRKVNLATDTSGSFDFGTVP
jgi:hypothetical protein